MPMTTPTSSRLTRFIAWSSICGGLGFAMGFKTFAYGPVDSIIGALEGVGLGLFIAFLFDSAAKLGS
jgi:hypothetical protein